MFNRFNEPVYVTRPILPDLKLFASRLQDVWDSRWLANGGPQHQVFEQKVREALKVPNLSLFNNGTIALLVAVQSLRLQGEVITTPFTFPATTHVLSWNGITPVFCDVDPQTMTLDPTKLEELITNRTSGILGVHVYGIPCDVHAIGRIAERHGLRVIYDAAHAFQTEIDSIGIGNFGDISMFSFHPTKLFHSGEGGCLTYADPNLKARIDLLKNFGIKNEVEVIMPGINGKMNELQALLGQLVLDIVAEERSRRAVVRRRYEEELKGISGLAFPHIPPSTIDSLQYLVIRIDAERFGASRDDVFATLRELNIHARKYFFPLTSDYPCYRNLPTARPELLPEAHRTAQEVLCLPFYGELPLETVSIICEAIRSVPAQAGRARPSTLSYAELRRG
jgi:dTDP-4-amino-4,6-dideoxygalactose transaminase